MGMIIVLLYYLLRIYEVIILLRCIMSFVMVSYGGSGVYRFYDFLRRLTDPLLIPIQNIMNKTPLANLPLDFSPMVAIIIVGVLERCLVMISRVF